jgi:F420H(2)-dependent quinone reductase
MAARLTRTAYAAIGSILTHPLIHPLHRLLYGWTAGRGIVGQAFGVPMVLLTTVGRRTGLPRTAPLVAIPDGDRWIVVPSNGGRRAAPSWLGNLVADPRATLQVGPRFAPVVARLASPEESERLWPLVTSVYRGFELYRHQAGRSIPLVVLEHPTKESE